MRCLSVVLSVIAVIFIEVCTTQVARGAARFPSPRRVLLSQYQDKANGNSAIVMTRDNRKILSECGINIMIDERLVVILEPGEVFVAYVNASTHRLGARFPKQCKGRGENLDITTHPGKALDVRIRYRPLLAGIFQTTGETDLAN